MKLYLDYGLPSQSVLTLSNDLLWDDEFKWSPVATKRSYSLTGALIIDVGTYQAGRPITLSGPQEMAWVTRDTLSTLKIWAALPQPALRLVFEYPTDTRFFTVMFDLDSQGCIEAQPVKGFPGHQGDDLFSVSLKFIEI